jgi:CBS domain
LKQTLPVRRDFAVGGWIFDTNRQHRFTANEQRAGGGNAHRPGHLYGGLFSGSADKRIKGFGGDVEATFDCTSDDDLSAVQAIICEKRVRRLPVLNEEGRLVGLLSLSDIARQADEDRARGAANRYVTDAEVARLAADISKRRRD